jgi:hypothetical protein
MKDVKFWVELLLVVVVAVDPLEGERYFASDYDPNSLRVVTRHLKSIFNEFYANAPVNSKCIKSELMDDELNLALSMIHDEDKLNAANGSEAMEELLGLMINKVVRCFDSKAFENRLMMIYEHSVDENMKRCVNSAAKNHPLDEKCWELFEKLYAEFSIDEIFLESLSLIGFRNFNNKLQECSNNLSSNNVKRLPEVLESVAAQKFNFHSDGEALNRLNLENFYKDSLKNLSICFQSQTDEDESFLRFDLIKIYDSTMRANLTIAIVLSCLMVLKLFFKAVESRIDYEEIN